MKALHPGVLARALRAVVLERRSQDTRFGEQNWPDGTAVHRADVGNRTNRQIEYEQAKAVGKLTWRHVLAEEVAEAFAEDDPVRLREELVQVAAVALAWVEALDRRTAKESA